ncbi:hypothetical protein AXG93_3818s1640 [Marchantia polymorpha subsp. ruderalis]|uniref:Uncharacterized protein n=1 Tax=Marchantia polymorpha subsp. ruderalis TaxID=1480154 RepID=A0A176VJP7_MARPO|nr:hypothetical protein AXG93_3818s1640 [Marchantia polymorpha subsp. ruderalis]
MESLPARLAIDRESIVPGVCMVDNWSGLFRLFGYSEVKVGTLPIPDPTTSLGGASDKSYFMTRKSIAVQLRHDHAHDSSQFGVRAVVTSLESYDVLVGGVVLCCWRSYIRWIFEWTVGRRLLPIVVVGSLAIDV